MPPFSQSLARYPVGEELLGNIESQNPTLPDGIGVQRGVSWRAGVVAAGRGCSSYITPSHPPTTAPLLLLEPLVSGGITLKDFPIALLSYSSACQPACLTVCLPGLPAWSACLPSVSVL